ncbi:MAG TPA: hypothetical protein VKR83_15990 [Ktedonobacteraceae bacterium]|nr:hypothetical protein [Ktedonobacteraceae bacterium]
MRRTKLTKPIVGLSIGLLLVALFAFSGAGRAFAAACTTPNTTTACDTVTAIISGGGLAATTTPPPSISITEPGTGSTTLPITAVDDRGGTPLGWTVSLTLSTFTSVTPAATLSNTGTASLTGLTITDCTATPTICSDTGLASVPTCIITTAAPIVITTDGATAARVCDTGIDPASVDQGTIVLTPTITVAVPFNATPGTYTSNAVVTIASDV